MIQLPTSCIIRTDTGFKLLRGYIGKIHPRSSFALCFTDTGGGLIDADYRGPISVIFFNFSDKFFHIEKANRFCQIVFQKIASSTKLIEVEKVADMAWRGEGSFGSTGLRNVW